MKLSIVVPAFNEEKLISSCLESIQTALVANQNFDFESEVIVVDNNSTDRTAELAKMSGARVIFEPVNQISRARNSGAAHATGEWLLFIDADSFPGSKLMEDVFNLIKKNEVVGCGSTVRMEGIPFYGRLLLEVWTWLSVLFSWAAGSFILSRADAFRDIGGFSEDLYASEEIEFRCK